MDYSNLTGNPASLALTGADDLGRVPSTARASTSHHFISSRDGNASGRGERNDVGTSNGNGGGNRNTQRMSRYSTYESAQGRLSAEGATSGGSGGGGGVSSRERGIKGVGNGIDRYVPVLPYDQAEKREVRDCRTLSVSFMMTCDDLLINVQSSDTEVRKREDCG